ncbi:MAG TPA: hypothetical protein VHT91_49045 [Kofleriaceae bacterium]|nr:hypothetical protein [Kofleriaceae bacterium]
MARDDEIQAIVEIGRRTRAAVPRSLWIAAAIVGGICTAGLAVALLGESAPAPGRTQPQAQAQIDERSEETGGGDPAGSAGGAGGRAPRGIDERTGWGTGLAVGAAGGLVVGFALGRHRRDHSSRSRP